MKKLLIFFVISLSIGYISCNKDSLSKNSTDYYTDFSDLNYLPGYDLTYEIVETNILVDSILVDEALSEFDQPFYIDKKDVPTQRYRFNKRFEVEDNVIYCYMPGETCARAIIDGDDVIIVKIPKNPTE